MDIILDNIIKKLTSNFNVESIFVYGSRARGDYLLESDYEIGVIFKTENYISRNVLFKLIDDPKIKVFPFKKEEIDKGIIDTPFQKKIYLKSLICDSSKTIYGENILSTIKEPTIHILDLIQENSFLLGNSLSAVFVSRTDNHELAGEMFFKSVMYAYRILLLLDKNMLINSYNEIYIKSFELLDVPLEYQKLLEKAYEYRNGNINKIDSNDFYKCISFINKYIEQKLLKVFEENEKAIIL